MTAETAVVLPVLVLVTMALVWVVSLAATQVRVVDAARETARALARDEAPAQALRSGRRVAPADARIAVERSTGKVAVEVTAPVRGPGGLLAFLPSATARSRAVAATEGR